MKLMIGGDMVNVSLYDRVVKVGGRQYVYREAAASHGGKIVSVRGRTDKEAMMKLAERLGEKRVEPVLDSAPFDVWADRLIAYTESIGRAPSYVANLGDFRRHLRGTWFGRKGLQEIATADVSLIIAEITAKPYHRGSRLIERHSPQFANLLRQFVRRVFNHARASGVSVSNPVTRETVIRLNPGKKVALSKEQVGVLLGSLSCLQDRLLVGLGLMAIRPGEICGLKLSDVNLEEGKITIGRQVRSRKGGGKTETALKTVSSERDVPIVPWLRTLLSERLLNGDKCEYLLHTARCNPLDNTYISKRIPKLLKVAQETENMPMIKAYWLKHTGISEMHNAGLPLSTISAITGVSATTLLRHYIQPHGFEERARLMASALDY